MLQFFFANQVFYSSSTFLVLGRETKKVQFSFPIFAMLPCFFANQVYYSSSRSTILMPMQKWQVGHLKYFILVLWNLFTQTQIKTFRMQCNVKSHGNWSSLVFLFSSKFIPIRNACSKTFVKIEVHIIDCNG